MSARDDDGPAFPVPPELCQDLTIEEQRGMTLRDYFAAKAMAAILHDMEAWYELWEAAKKDDPEHNHHPHQFACMIAYDTADFMLRQRRS